MESKLEKRSCKRFSIPDAKVRYWKKGWFSFLSGGSKPTLLRDISKGGLSFECNDGFKPNELVDVELLIPGENALSIRANVKWQRVSDGNYKHNVGVAFVPFGSSSGSNDMAVLEKLRELDTLYVPQAPPEE